MSEHYYTPGVCNINKAEVNNRRRAGYLGTAVTAVLGFVLIIIQSPPITGVVMFVPVYIATIGFLQAKHKFCVGYAVAGVYSKSKEFADTANVLRESQKEIDQKRAKVLNQKAFRAGLVGALVSIIVLAVLQSR